MKNPTTLVRRSLSALFLLLTISVSAAFAQTTAFTYQGRFTDTTVSQPTNGTYSMTFRLYDALSGGNQIGSAVTTSVSVVNGIFAAQLDFGAAAFTTTGARYLEIQVGASTLTPRQQITSTPFSVRSTNAGEADALSANCVLCIQNGQLNANSVTTSKVANGTIINSKLTQDSVNSLNIIDNSIVNADINPSAAIEGTKIIGSTITNLNASNLASGTVPVARLGTNTPSATTYLRGDNTWQTVSSGSNVSPFAARSAAVVLNSGTLVDIVSINLEANKTYFMEGNIIGNRSGATSGGARCRTTYSGTATTDYGLQQNGTLFNFTTIDSTGAYDSESTGQAASTPWAAALTYRYTITGYLRTSTAGALTISCARASFNTTVDINVREGSYINARPLN